MKFFVFVAVVAVAVASVGAVVPRDSNALRFARGLPPRAPRNLRSRVQSARRSMPSGSPSQCSSGALQCCNSSGSPSDPTVALLLELLGITDLPDDALVGVTCSSVGSGGTCSQTPLCCTNNSFSGLIATGCTSVS